MIRRSLARMVTVVALLAASAAWAGWVYLHTGGDPGRSRAVAHAVLDDPAARHELAGDVAVAVADAANRAIEAAAATGSPGALGAPHIDPRNPVLLSAVDAALADPAVVSSVVDALSNAQAAALGVTPTGPTTIDTGVLVAAVRAHLPTVDPTIATRLPAIPAASIKLPTVDVPLARRIRTLAVRWDGDLALIAVAGLALAFAMGGRLRTVRAAGFWAVGAAATWAVLPRVLVWAAGRWAPGHAALVRAVLHGAAGPVNATATTLATAGVAAVVASFVLPHLTGWIPARDHAGGVDDRTAPRSSGFGSVGSARLARSARRGRRAGGVTPAPEPATAPGRWDGLL